MTRELEQAVAELFRYSVEVRGSWANREYHYIERESGWDSLSDIDLVSQNVLDMQTRDRISAILKSGALHLHSELAISFRTADELGEVYRRERTNTPERRDSRETERLLLFWLSIGIAEACSSTAKHRNFRGCDVRAYFLNKLYLNAWRMVYHVNGTCLQSYADVVRAIRISPDSKRTSLRLKHGVDDDPNTTAALRELGSSLLNAMARLAPPAACTGMLKELGADSLSSQSVLSSALDILEIARTYASTPVDVSIIEHSAAKITRMAGIEGLTQISAA